MVEHPHRMNHFVPVGRAVFHAIFEDDFGYLLEVNHVRNVTVLPEVREPYLDLVVRWASGATSG